jgi:hypothetical protein
MSEDAPAPTPTPLRLDPANAALSIRVRVRQIAEAEKYVRETVARYDGLRSFHAELERMGIAEEVFSICTVPVPPPNPVPAADEGSAT